MSNPHPRKAPFSRPSPHDRATHAPSTRSSAPPQAYHAPGDPHLSSAAPLTLNHPFHLDRRLVQRLRLRETNTKEAFTIQDATGAWFRAAFQELTDRGGTAVPYERMARSPEPTIDITLAAAILARQRMHLVMQKATELGVMRIIPLLTEHSVPAEAVPHEQAHAWPSHIARATRQCRRGSLPQLLAPTSLDAFLASPLCVNADLRLYLDDRSDPAAPDAHHPRRIILLVGPEGGFSDAERSRLAQIARPWVLGSRILRAETACIAGLTAIQVLWGDLVQP